MLSTALILGLAALAQARPQALPARFDAGLVSVQAPRASGAALSFYTDTGGALVIGADAVRRLGLRAAQVRDPALKAELGAETRAVDWASLKVSKRLPAPAGPLVVIPANRQLAGWPVQGDGILGQAWFGDHVWTWDYPQRRLLLDPPHWAPRDADAVNLGFPFDRQGRREDNFPRIVVEIDGQQLSMLLDTGAETLLTAAAARQLDAPRGLQATSMVVASIFDHWHAAHPDWPVVRGAQVGTGAEMIRVPEVVIAGDRGGPVWFTRRPDAAYHDYLSKMMDARVEGSIGGNALAPFRMTIDYPDALAWFVCATACRRSPR